MTSYHANFDLRQFYNFVVIALCVVSQPCNRKVYVYVAVYYLHNRCGSYYLDKRCIKTACCIILHCDLSYTHLCYAYIYVCTLALSPTVWILSVRIRISNPGIIDFYPNAIISQEVAFPIPNFSPPRLQVSICQFVLKCHLFSSNLFVGGDQSVFEITSR